MEYLIIFFKCTKNLIISISVMILFLTIIALIFCDADVINTALLAITAVLVLWYTYETHQLREQMVEQKELSIMPIIIFVCDCENKKMFLENIGDGIGKNVKIIKFISQYTKNKPERSKKFDCEKYFPYPINYLRPKEKKELTPYRYDSSSVYDELFMSENNQKSSVYGTKDITIQYQNFESTTYETNIQIDNLNISDTKFKKYQ